MNVTAPFVSVLMSLVLAAQLPLTGQGPPEQESVWLVRARVITEQLVKDAQVLTRRDRPLLWARLGEAWWEDDVAQARAWLRGAVEEVELISPQETKAERDHRIKAVRALLPLIMKRDKNLADRLTAVLLAAPPVADGRTPDDEREQNAEALANAAREMLETDAVRAAELARASVRAGASYRMGPLILAIHRRDAALAVGLFNELLAAADASGDEAMLSALAGAAFPHRLYFPPFEAPVLPEAVRASTLGVYARRLLRPIFSPEDEASACMSAQTAHALMDQFVELLPQQAGAVRQLVGRCQQRMSAADRQFTNEVAGEETLRTVDDYLRAARETADERKQSFFLARAAYICFNDDKPDRALEILESMTAAHRKQIGEDLWENWRWVFAASSARGHFKRGDRQMMRRVLDAVPVKLRGFALTDLASELLEAEERVAAAELLAEARGLLARSDAPDEEKQHFRLTLTRLYAVLAPEEGPQVLAEAVASINRAERLRSKMKKDEPAERPWDVFWKPISLPVSLIETDELATSGATAEIEPALARARARLGLLEAVMKKRRDETASRNREGKPPASRPAGGTP